MLARYLLACLELQKLPERTVFVETSELENRQDTLENRRERQGYRFTQHTDPKRFKGTRVYLASQKISPDYAFVAYIDHIDNNGDDIYVTWLDLHGKKYGPHLLEPEETISLINMKDAEALKIPATPPEFIREVISVRHRTRERVKPENIKPDTYNPIEKLSGFLKKQGIGNRLQGDRIFVIMGRYYIDFASGAFEMGDVKRGIMARFKESKEGVKKLVQRIQKIENELDYEKILEQVSV